MKLKYLLPSLFALPGLALAQDAKLTKHRLSDNLSEQYTVSADDSKSKQGIYLIYNDENKLIVRGAYKNGQKTGKWRFFDPEQHLTQVYDYNDNKIYFSNADSLSYVTTDYVIPEKTDENDDVIPPVKIGGSTFTFLALYSPKLIPPDIAKAKEDIQLTYTFDVSETGKTENVIATYAVGQSEEKRKIQIKNPDLFDFIPAKLKGKPVKSKVTFKSTIYVDKYKIPGNNNTMSTSKS